MTARRTLVAIAAMTATASFAFACVDLFHSTDFDTLCSLDAAACSDAATVDAPVDAKAPVEAGAVDFCAWSKAEALQHAQNACAWMGACEGSLGNTVFGPCMVRALAAYDCEMNPALRPAGEALAIWQCLANVRSCGEVDTCLFPSGLPPCAPASDGGAFTTCLDRGAGSFLVECARPEGGRPSGVDVCALSGRSCAAAQGGLVACAGGAKVPCEADPHCEGTSAIECSVGETFDRGVDCANSGAGRCAFDPLGRAACEPLADAGGCTTGIDIECVDGGVAASCVGGKLVAIDCSRLGVGCDATTFKVIASDPVQACADNAPATRCAGPDTCTGGKLRSCGQGATFEVSCTSLGLAGCQLHPTKPFGWCVAP